MNLATVIVGLVLVAIVGLIIRSLKNEQGGCSSASGCAGCPMGGSCHKKSQGDVHG